MYKVILAEDEPGAAQNIQDIFRLYCPQFNLIATADCGDDGMALARRYRPDLLLTDIRMPKMNGLELITKLREELPSIFTIIISGYQDFEYTRTAMQNGASDYILKPVTPRILQAALERIIPLIDEQKNQEKLSLIRRLLYNESVQKKKLEKYFASPAYIMAVSRKNGLPSRFTRSIHNLKYHIKDESLDIYGRDEMESIHICFDNSLATQEAFNRINWLHRDIPGYTTTVLCTAPFHIEKLPEIIKSLYTILDSSLTIGVTQLIPADRQIPKTGESDNETSILLDRYIKELKIGDIYNLFTSFLKKCREKKFPQIYVEKSIRLLLEKVRLFSNYSARDDETEFMIDDAFFHATSYEELKESIQDIIKRLLQEQSGSYEKVDSPEFFQLIREYISLQLAGKITLQSICKHFGISQTYISRLFRKYTGQSFINYLTGVRIEKAKDYMANQDILIKDVAVMVGFSDQFYFTRVFRTLTGQSPSQYQYNNSMAVRM